MEKELSQEKKVQAKRPWGLRIACIFSMVYNGILLALSIVSFFYVNYFFNILERAFNTGIITPLSGYLILMGFAFLFILTILSVILMWDLKIEGFYLYIILKSLLIILLLLSNYLNYFNIGLSVFMLLVYWSYRKRMQNSRKTLHN